MDDEHASAVLRIYQAGLDTGNASFETEAPRWKQFIAHKVPEHCHVVVNESGAVIGWVAAGRVSERCVYDGVIEHSVYVDPIAQRRGVGADLLDALIRSAETSGIWTIQSGIFPENTASLRLHERAGFRIVGVREKLGCHHGTTWRDVVMLERRSPSVGVRRA